MNVKLSASLLAGILILGGFAFSQEALGFAYVFSQEEPEIQLGVTPLQISNGVIYEDDVRAFLEVGPLDVSVQNLEDIITHPLGYACVGGVLGISVGIDPTSAHAAQMLVPGQNIVDAWNGLTPTTGNLVPGALGAGQIDWESVAAHELGHAIGLAHPNAASESGLAGADQDYTKATDGANDVFNINAGVDTVRGSSDDVRGDDDNLNHFRISNNNPFTLGATVDSTTYSRVLGPLPVGHLFSANPSRDVGALLGFANSEAVMQQGTFITETQRTLGHDDVAGIQRAQAGCDGIAGNADDHTINLTFDGLSAASDIVLDFDDSQTTFAVTFISGVFIGGAPGFVTDNIGITSSSIFFADDIGQNFEWFFTAPPPTGCTTNVDCNDNNACTTDVCNNPPNGQCSNTPLVCDDSNACNGLETCDTATGCVAGTPLVCDDNDVCNGGETCDNATGCVAGTPLVCDDSDACNGQETCDASTGCEAGTPPNCDDGQFCTLDSCDPASGCEFTRNPDPICQPTGGEFIGIDTTMVLAAGAQSTAAWMIPIILSAIGIAIVIARKFSKYQPI